MKKLKVEILIKPHTCTGSKGIGECVQLNKESIKIMPRCIHFHNAGTASGGGCRNGELCRFSHPLPEDDTNLVFHEMRPVVDLTQAEMQTHVLHFRGDTTSGVSRMVEVSDTTAEAEPDVRSILSQLLSFSEADPTSASTQTIRSLCLVFKTMFLGGEETLPFTEDDRCRAFIRMSSLSIRQLIEEKSRLLLSRSYTGRTVDNQEIIGQLHRHQIISSSLEKSLYEAIDRCNRQIHSVGDVEALEQGYIHITADLNAVLRLWKI